MNRVIIHCKHQSPYTRACNETMQSLIDGRRTVHSAGVRVVVPLCAVRPSVLSPVRHVPTRLKLAALTTLRAVSHERQCMQ